MSKKINNIICIDFETGGLDPQKNAITEVGAVAFRLDTFEELWSYQSYITPHYTKKKQVKALKSKKRLQTELFNEESFTYEQKALDYTKITMEMLESRGKDIKVVAAELTEKFKAANPDGGRTTKPVILGHNIPFDKGYLQHLADIGGMDLEKLLDGTKDYYGNFQPRYVDTLQMVKEYFALDEGITMHKLSYICEQLGIELIEAHSALDDVYATVDVYKALINKMRSGNGVMAAGKKEEKTRLHFNF